MVRTVGNSRLKSLLIVVMMLAMFESFAQEEDSISFEDSRKQYKHYLGAKAGRNFSWVNFDPRVNQSISHGPVFGISYAYMSQHWGGIMVEAQYIKYGWKESFPDSIMVSYSRELSYLEIPAMSNFVIGKKNTHLKFQLGVKLGILLDQVENSDLINDEARIYYGQEIEDRFELGLAFGTSLSYVFNFGELQADFRFNASLSNLFPPTDDLSLIYSQNQSFTVSVYYWFKVR